MRRSMIFEPGMMNPLDLVFFKRKRIYHMGIVVTKELVNLPPDSKNVMYIWESSCNKEFADYRKKRYKGIKLCELDLILERLSLRKNQRVYYCPLKLENVNIGKIRDSFTHFFSSINGMRFRSSKIDCLGNNSENRYSSNEFVTLIFKNLGLIKGKYVPCIEEYFNNQIPGLEIKYPRRIL
jgi:hypothetical protein